MARFAAVLSLILMPGSLAAQDLIYDAGITERCLENAEMSDERLACSGRASGACMNATPEGNSTVGMGACLSNEAGWWDERLNTVYRQAMAQAKATDAETQQMGRSLPSQSEALRDMQRAWISFRDRKCDFEATLWQGGTGTGPAYMACLMHTTAQQVIFLEGAASW